MNAPAQTARFAALHRGLHRGLQILRSAVLPDWLKIHSKAELRQINLDPGAHYTAAFLEKQNAWCEMARDRLLGRVKV